MSTGFFLVCVRASPFTGPKEIGYYSNPVAALKAATVFRKHNPNLDVICLQSKKEPKADIVIKKEVDSEEQSRLIALKFREVISLKRFSEKELEGPSFKRAKTRHLPENLRTPLFNPKLAGERLTEAVEIAQKNAQEKYGSTYKDLRLCFSGSGDFAMSVGPREVNPIELQSIVLMADKEDGTTTAICKVIGKLWVEKDPLKTLKAADELAEEISVFVNQTLSAVTESPKL